MTLEPRQVEDGYAKRWCRQALELVFRSFHLWFGLNFGLALVLAVLPFGGLVAIPVGVFAYVLSCELAALSDRSNLTLSTLRESIQQCAQYTGRSLWNNRVALLIALVISFTLVLAISVAAREATASTPPRPAPDYGSIWTWLFGQDSPFLSFAVALWVGSFMAAGFARRLPMLRYCLARWADESAADVALEKAAQKNVFPSFFIEMLHMGCLTVSLVLAPSVAPFLMCFLPAVSYVAFREMFIDDQGNRPAPEAVLSALTPTPKLSP